MTDIAFKRKLRWTFEASFPSGSFGPFFMMVSNRPALPSFVADGEIYDEQTLTTTLFDPDDKQCESLFKAIAPFIEELPKGNCLPHEMSLAEYFAGKLGTGVVKLYDGCGFCMEEWALQSLYVLSAEFSDLDHSNSDPEMIDIVWKFKEYKYTNHCKALDLNIATMVPGNTQMGIGLIGESRMDLSEYKEVDTLSSDFQFLPGDVIYHRKTRKIELVITPRTDLVQEEVYPLVENFGCLLFRKQ